jgi:hypothetical protein
MAGYESGEECGAARAHTGLAMSLPIVLHDDSYHVLTDTNETKWYHDRNSVFVVERLVTFCTPL